MTEHEDTRAVQRAFHAGILPVQDPAARDALRESTVPRIERTIRRGALLRKRALRLRWLGAAVACAASVAAIATLTYWSGEPSAPPQAAAAKAPQAPERAARSLGGRTLVRTGKADTRALTAKLDVIRVGDRIETSADGRASIELPRAQIQLGPSARLLVGAPSGSTQRVELAQGKLSAIVESLGSHEPKLVIETPDANVIVTGTRLSVEVQRKDDEPRTVVSVSEGTVTVASHGVERAKLHAGSSWSSRHDVRKDDRPTRKAIHSGRAARTERKDPIVATKTGRPKRERASTESTLSKQNALYQTATDAKNRGDFSAAAAAFRTLLRRFPASPLAHETRVELLRALVRLNRREEAHAVAQRYLSAYPNGPARSEAQAALE